MLGVVIHPGGEASLSAFQLFDYPGRETRDGFVYRNQAVCWGNGVRWCRLVDERNTWPDVVVIRDADPEDMDLIKSAVGVLLLARDPDFFQPSILNKDEHRRDSFDMGFLVDRAKRRGKFGFELGRNIDVCPHMRRPHFAIRWTGKGGSVPRLVPVKGSIIHRSKAMEIPSGFDGPIAV